MRLHPRAQRADHAIGEEVALEADAVALGGAVDVADRVRLVVQERAVGLIFVVVIELPIGTTAFGPHFIVAVQVPYTRPLRATRIVTGGRTSPANWALNPLNRLLGAGIAGGPAGALAARSESGRVNPRHPRALKRTVPSTASGVSVPETLKRSRCPLTRFWPEALNAEPSGVLPFRRATVSTRGSLPQAKTISTRIWMRPSSLRTSEV